MVRRKWIPPWRRRWTQSRLLSRKLALATGYIGVALGADLAGHPLASATLSNVRDVVLAFLAVQGALDWRKAKTQADFETGALVAPENVDVGGDA